MLSSTEKTTPLESKKSLVQPLNMMPYFASTIVKEIVSTKDVIIHGPNNTPVSFILVEPRDVFTFLDEKTTGVGIKLQHSRANVVAGVDDQTFASASNCSVKIWEFNKLESIKEFELFNNPTTNALYKHSGYVHSMQLLPEQRFLVGFTSTYAIEERVSGCIWVVDVDRGLKFLFDLSNFGQLMFYKIAVIPNEPQRFVLYNFFNTKDIFIFEIDFKKNALNLIAMHKNLKVGNFEDLKVSADGKYWAGSLSYQCKETSFGVQVYQVDKNYNLTCIAKMFHAGTPQWNEGKLLYSFKGQILEFDPENIAHTILTSKLVVNDENTKDHSAYYNSAKISPCVRPGFFQVARPGHWQTYSQELNILLQAELHANLVPPVVNIINEYLDIVRPQLTYEFGDNTLFKKPLSNGVAEVGDNEKGLTLLANKTDNLMPQVIQHKFNC